MRNARHGQIRLLLAEDNSVYLECLVSIFDDIKEISIVGKAVNGLELVRLHQEYRPDIILTDIRMPEMDGIEAIQRVRRSDAEVGILCLSSEESVGLMLEAKEAGANGYLIKNASRDQILESIIKLFNKEPFHS